MCPPPPPPHTHPPCNTHTLIHVHTQTNTHTQTTHTHTCTHTQPLSVYGCNWASLLCRQDDGRHHPVLWLSAESRGLHIWGRAGRVHQARLPHQAIHSLLQGPEGEGLRAAPPGEEQRRDLECSGEQWPLLHLWVSEGTRDTSGLGCWVDGGDGPALEASRQCPHFALSGNCAYVRACACYVWVCCMHVCVHV